MIFRIAFGLAVLVSINSWSDSSRLSAQQTETKSNENRQAIQSAKLWNEKVRALLNDKCSGCHNDEDLEGKYSMESRPMMLAGGESGEPAILPGKAAESPLFQAVTWKNDDFQMPPKEQNRLTPAEISLIEKWINTGAIWSEPNETPEPTSPNSQQDSPKIIATSGGLSKEWDLRPYAAADVWSFQPIQRYAVPERGIDTQLVNNPVDAFIQQKLREQNLQPAELADKRILVRRLTFDLTGLPPTREQVAAFLKDESPDAYNKLAVELINSKHYGEQMARHWLDVVRFADSAGFSNDYEQPNAWRYRDYVVRSFNNDKPFDRFVLEQLAGDELDPNDTENLIAVGYLRMGPWEHTGMSVKAVTRQQYLDDITNNVGVAFLGHALRCARCHDHKFDPLPTRDYYRIQAVFAPVQFVERPVPFRGDEMAGDWQADQAWTTKMFDEANTKLRELNELKKTRETELLKEKGVEKLADLPLEERSRLFGLNDFERSMQKLYQKRSAYFARELQRYRPQALSVYSGSDNDYDSHKQFFNVPADEQRYGLLEPVSILRGGAIESPLEPVTPGVLSAVAGSNDALSPTAWNSIPESADGRRLAFARWVADANNTLTARVFVNRVWQMHFGTGLVATPNSFGKMGAKPSHPELLDWLATWFIEHDWSVKKLHLLIVNSRAYQQSNSPAAFSRIQEIDSQNRLLAYFPVRRLAAEELRDAMLSVSGELNPQVGGPPAFPEINWEVAMQPRHIMGSVAPAYQPHPDPQQRHRRTLYAFRRRTLEDPLLEVFNRPGSDLSCERRDETTVTPQVFALFNSQFSRDRAIALAARLKSADGTIEEQVESLFQIALNREPTPEERRFCKEHVERMIAFHEKHPPVPRQIPTEVQREMFEELTGKVFVWTEELDRMKAFKPDLKPWNVDAATRGMADLCLVVLNSNEFIYVR